MSRLRYPLLLLVALGCACQTPPSAPPETSTQPEASEEVRTRPPRPAVGGVIDPPDFAGGGICPEWYPAIGTLIVWPFEIPDALVIELARDDRLFVMVAYGEEQAARDELLALDIEESRFDLLPSTVETCWTRDFGPHMVFDEDWQLTLVDPVYIDTPGGWADYSGARDERPLRYWNDYPGDDTSPEAVEEHLGWPRVEVAAYLTGGNFLVDGLGRAFSTQLMVDENLQIMDAATFEEVVERVTGVNDHVILHDTEEFGIQHIDCWFKVVDPETLLVKRAPEGHPEAAWIERNLEILEELETSLFGTPYRILRVDCPPFEDERLPAYTNSLILNDKVLVPLFGDEEADAAALATWREALPGYRVIGFPYEGWREFDALHCRTRAVFDPDMLLLIASRYQDDVPEGMALHLAVLVADFSGAGLVEEELALYWRPEGEVEWRREALPAPEGAGAAGAAIPDAPLGSTIEYYFSAASKSGRRATLPVPGPAGPWKLEVR